MTDEQIEKGCELCSKRGDHCEQCPYYGDDIPCFRQLPADCLAYIKRLKDEIAGLTSKAEAIESFKEENERLCVALKLAQTRAMDLERIPELFGGAK